MNGLGFLIWKLSNLPATDQVIRVLMATGVRWVSIKVADGIYKFNSLGGNDKPLLAFIEALRSAGIQVGGWHYVYALSSPGAQGDRIMERREKLDLREILVNIEDPRFRDLSTVDANNWAKVYMGKQHAGTTYGHCSHRFPVYHPYIPHNRMLRDPNMDAITPMVYWEGAHNPVEQLRRSLTEYRAMSDKPFIPIGPTYAHAGWEPSVDDLLAFEDECFAQGFPGRAYYSLDWVLQHGRQDWLNAIAQGEETPPPLPPPVEPEEYTIVNCDWLNGRSMPEVVNEPGYGNKIVSLRAGQRVTNLKKASGDWLKCGLGPVECWMHGDYLEPVA